MGARTDYRTMLENRSINFFASKEVGQEHSDMPSSLDRMATARSRSSDRRITAGRMEPRQAREHHCRGMNTLGRRAASAALNCLG